jgi:hypothetical protein
VNNPVERRHSRCLKNNYSCNLIVRVCVCVCVRARAFVAFSASTISCTYPVRVKILSLKAEELVGVYKGCNCLHYQIIHAT